MKHQLRTEVTIDAPVSTVWQLLTDLTGYADWNPFITSAKGHVAEGERLINRIQPPGGRPMTFKPTVTVVEDLRAFEWLGRLGLPGVFDGRHRFELTAVSDNVTRMVHSESFSGALVRPLRKSLDTQTREGFEAMNLALKRQAENQPTRCS